MEGHKVRVKFIQIASSQEAGKLYALDEGGRIWEYIKGSWSKITSPTQEMAKEVTGYVPVWPKESK